MSVPVPVRGAERIRRALLGSYPLLYVQSWEESRVERSLALLAQKFYERPVPFAVWTCVDGWTGLGEAPADTRDPLRAIDVVLQAAGPGFFLMKDLPALLEERPDVVRKLRDAYRQMKGKGKFLVMVSPRLILPEDMKKEIFLVDFDLPDEAEVRNAITILGKRYLGEGGLGPADADRVVTALRGQTLDELEHVFAKVFARTPRFDESTFDELLAEKEQSSRKEGVLEYVPPRVTLDDIGGLENLKDWLRKRQNLFTREAVEAGLPVPKGLLMMGMSGCGKSLSVKTIPALWNLPLFRLDMNLVFGTANPEATFHRALKTTEGLAPAILWIDEIEMAISGGREAGGGDPALGRIFSTFLTWMQEKEALVFVAATANRIHLLPAEFIRKGRFDQVFFVDLPNETERKAIFTVHLRKQNADLAKFDAVFLSKATKGYNGAEIESIVQTAAIDAFNEKRQLDENDVSRIITNTVALSRTMDEQIKAIKSWAHNRAISASRESAT
jgi:SpoVK/Ycf46/Vps4 family AAA+-type ATPase